MKLKQKEELFILTLTLSSVNPCVNVVKSLDLADHSKTGPLDDLRGLDHYNTRLIRYLDGYCIDYVWLQTY